MIKEELEKLVQPKFYANNINRTIKAKNPMVLDLKLRPNDGSFIYYGDVTVHFPNTSFYPKVFNFGIDLFTNHKIKKATFSLYPGYKKKGEENIIFYDFARDSKYGLKTIPIMAGVEGRPRKIQTAVRGFMSDVGKKWEYTGHLYYVNSTCTTDDEIEHIRYDLEIDSFKKDGYDDKKRPILKVTRAFSRKQLLDFAEFVDNNF